MSFYIITDIEKFFVTWILLKNPGPNPGMREMHSTCFSDGKMIIMGGRNEKGDILSDCWILSCSDNFDKSNNHSSNEIIDKNQNNNTDQSNNIQLEEETEIIEEEGVGQS